MMLFTILLVLGWERIFGLSSSWHLEQRLESIFRRQQHFSMIRTGGMVVLAMLITSLLLEWFQTGLGSFGIFLIWIITSVLCIGAGVSRQHYRAYLTAASQQNEIKYREMAKELSLIYPIQGEVGDTVYLRKLQNALLWINYRCYLAPLLWLMAGGEWGPVLLVGYSFLRTWQIYLARHYSTREREQSGVDQLLFWLDWVPVRIIGLIYACVGKGERALAVWIRAIYDFRHTPYHFLALISRMALEQDASQSAVEMTRSAVTLAKRTTLILVIITACLTIFDLLP